MERLVNDTFASLFPGKDSVVEQLRRVEVHRASVHLFIDRTLATRIDQAAHPDITYIADGSLMRLLLSLRLGTGKGCKVQQSRTCEARANPALIRALRKAHTMVERDAKGFPVIAAAPVSPYLRKLVRLAFLSPDIQLARAAGASRATSQLDLRQASISSGTARMLCQGAPVIGLKLPDKRFRLPCYGT
jgi:site-specific DNA recombinase